jgi:Nucleotidyltransferase domain
MPNKFVIKRLAIAKNLSRDLRREYGTNIEPIGLTGSVARGKAERYSDIDVEIIVKKPTPQPYQSRIIENIYCSLNFATPRDALREVAQPHPELPEKLGGFTMIRRLYDPKGFLTSLQKKANHVPTRIFRKSAELALLHSYEDFCWVKNAYVNNDQELLQDNVNYVTHSGSLIVACLNNSHFASDREIFTAYKRFEKLPRGFERIRQLRYGHFTAKKLLETTMSFYLNLIEFCSNEGIQFPVEKNQLQDLTKLVTTRVS